LKWFSVDDKKSSKELWVVRRPDRIRQALTGTKWEAEALAKDLNELQELRVVLAWTAGQLSESQACALLGYTPKQINECRDRCLRHAPD
jgi:hypothetical protein